MNDELLGQAARWLAAGEPVALATIVRIFGSSSQPLGTRMAMTRGDRFVGAVSGGCVETDVYEAARDVLSGGEPLMLHYKQVDDPLLEIGLNCEGQIDVLVELADRPLLDLLTAPERGVNVTVCTPGQPHNPAPLHARVRRGAEPPSDLPAALHSDALAALKNEDASAVTYPDGRVALFEPVQTAPLLLIFGADPVAVPLVRLARVMGFRTVVTDGRPAFATRDRHPDADEVIAAWPEDVIARLGVDDRTFVVSLNHEPRFEDALLRALAGREIAYLGAIGKPQRATERAERADAAGVDLDRLPLVHTPIGLDIGGKTPEDIALSILAEMIAVRHGRSGGMLSGGG